MAETKTNTEDGVSKLSAEMNTERAGSHSHGLGVDLNSISNLSSLPAMASSTSIPGIHGARPESILSPEQAFVSAEQALHATELVKEFYRLLKVPLGAAAPSPGWAGFRREEDGEIPSCFSCRKPEMEGKTVICDSCERSFHTVCVKMKPRQATELDEWVCSRCEAEGVRPRFPLGKRLGPEIGEPRFSHESCLKDGDEGNVKDDVQAKKRGFETDGNGDGDSASPLNQDKDAFTASPGMSCKERPRRPSVVAMAYGDGNGYRDRDRNREGDGDLKLPTVAFSVQESNIEPLNQGKGTFVRPLTMSMADGNGHGGGNGDSTLATSSFPSKEGNIEPLNQGKGIFASSPLINHKEFPRKSPTIAMADGDADSTTPTIAFPPKEGNTESLYQGTNRKERLRRPKRERDAEEDYPGMVKRVPLEASVSVGSEDIKLRASSRLKALYSGKDDITKEVETCTADQVLSESGNDETTINSSSRRGKGKGILRKDFHDTKLQCSDEEGEYIQKLRDFIEQQGGFLEDGWYLKIRRRPNGEKEIFYYSHDGQKFRSRKEVARFLGVLDWKKEDLDQRDNATSLLNSRRFIGVQKRVQESEGESDSDEDELPERQKFEVETSESEDEHFEPDIEVDLPLECMDLRIESLGTIVQHSESQEQDPIWPVGYCSSWHDSITASVFTSEVLDKGSAGPVFRVTRKSCSDFANLGYMEAIKNEEKESSLVSASRLKSDAIYDEDYELGMLLGNLTGPLVTEDCVMDFLNFPFYHDVNPSENIHKFNSINGEAEGGSKTIETMNKDADSDFLRQLFVKAEDNECMDLIGEVSVEGPTPIEAWAAMGKQIFAHLQEISIGARSFKFGCSHSEMRPLSPGSNPVEILETLGMETAVANGGDCNPLLITLRDWVGQDRFGFHIPVVQKLIARKPKVKVIRPPPPPGDPIGSKILDEGLVGDLLQIWEFLCRFSEILGLKDVQSLQDLEEALCMGMGSSVISPSGGEQTGSDCREEKAKIQNVVRKKSADLLSVSSSPPVGLDNIVLSSIHISLLRILLPELEQKLLGMSDLTLEAKQGKKKDVEPVISSTKGLTEGLVILNEATWPEVARRYIMAMLSLNNGVENADLSFQERWKVLKCIQGDGGALCGGLDGSAGIEVDAQLLAEAQKKVFHQDSAEGENVPTLENEEEDEVPEASGKPEWVSLLEPVRKLATNVGARIRNCIRDALEKDPPEWAKEMLEWSISKDVYKGNASGPTKRAVLSVLEKAAGLEKPLSPKKPKVKKVQPVLTISPEFIMRRCRAIIRELIASDGVRVFCNMLGGTVLGYYISEQDGAEVAPAMVSCPLDFRIIDARLAAGAYGVSHESFAADMQQLWTNLNTVFQDKPEMIKVGQSLFQQFESLFKEKVLDLVNYVQEQAAKSSGEEDTREENTPVIPEIKEEELLKAHWEWGVCKICGVDKDDDKVLLCDECDAEYHIYCLVPPLSKIPQGNWYCPTCIAGGKGVPSSEDIICRRVSRLSRAVSTDEGRALQSLAGAIVEKDYWDLGVSDKIRLLKFLCDKALDSNAIIENFDQYMDASLELQQKLYSLYEERKNAALEANTQQRQGIDLGKKPLQSMGGSNGEEALYKPEAKVLRSRDIDLNCIAGTSDQGLMMTEELILEGEKKDSNIRDSGINPVERIPLPISEGDQVKEANSVEGAPSQTISELIEMQIDKLEMEAMRMAMRREWLGRDLLNRHYWVLGWEGKLPWLVVDESGGSINEWASKLSNGSMTEKPNNILCESDKKRWMSYESDVGLERLLEWLRPTSRREQELKNSILRWRMSLLKGNGRSSANKDIVQRPLGRPRLITIVPATKAALFLVKRFGPIYWPDGDDGLLGGGRKRARPKSMGQSDECLFRCECLEIIWPSRCHCQGCHQTFDSTDELHSHDGGDCFSVAATAATAVTSDLANTPPLKTNKKKGGDGRSKKLKNAFEGTIKLKISKKQAKKFAFMAPDFEEILKVFKLPTSNQDRVRQIGFIAEETPAFAPTLSYSPIFDSLLTKSGKIKARGDHKGARLVEITNLGSILNVVEDGKRQKQACLKPKDVVVTPSKSAEPETPDTKGETASPNPQSSNGEEGGSTSNYTIPVRSLQPLSGRSLWVLRRLKANLLDMEALISLDALEPSRADPDKRRMWRSFVKSATSIFEVLQAEICLERALKADYLKETWCNWQSLSSTVQSATLSSLALRIFSLDAAIMYKKAKVVFDPNFPSKKGSSGSKKKVLEK